MRFISFFEIIPPELSLLENCLEAKNHIGMRDVV